MCLCVCVCVCVCVVYACVYDTEKDVRPAKRHMMHVCAFVCVSVCILHFAFMGMHAFIIIQVLGVCSHGPAT